MTVSHTPTASSKSAGASSVGSIAASSSVPSSVDKESSKTASAQDSSSISPSSQSMESMSESASASMGGGKPSLYSPSMSATESASQAVDSSVMDMSQSMSDTSSVALSTDIESVSASIDSERVEKIVGMDKNKIDEVVKNCQECAKVDNILVYKEGNIWKDYTGKIQMEMKDGKLVDKSGVFIGKDCSCSKDKIPEMGKVGETGLYQDKGVSNAECHKQANLMNELASAESASAASSMDSGTSSVGGSTPSNGSQTSGSTSSGSENAAVSSPTANSGAAASDTSSVGGTSGTDTGMAAGTSSAGGSDALPNTGESSSAMSEATGMQSEQAEPQASISSQQSTEPISVSPSVQQTQLPTQPQQNQPIMVKAVKLKYNLVPNDNCKKKDACGHDKKAVEYRTKTVTIIDQRPLPPNTIFKTVTRMVVPEVVSKTLTQILKAETVTITQKPDTVVKFSPPSTITSIHQQPPVTITKTRTKTAKVQSDEPSADMIAEPIQKTIGKKSPVNEESDEVVTIHKTIKRPSKGIECAPDCPCEATGTCDNPCMEMKCEIIE